MKGEQKLLLAGIFLAIATTAGAGVDCLDLRLTSAARGDFDPPNPSGLEQTASLIADVDLDGIDDFVIAQRRGTPAVVWYRRGATGWDRHVIENAALDIEAGGTTYDVDDDGDADIFLGGDSRTGEIWWWENPLPDLDPTAPWVRRTIRADGLTQHHNLLFADVDGDAVDELVFWSGNSSDRPELWLAEIPADPHTDQPWPATLIHTAERPSVGLEATDIDGDGILDLVGAGHWFERTSDGSFAPHAIDPEQAFTKVITGQWIAGGRPEVVFAVADRLPAFGLDGRGPLMLYRWTGATWEGQPLLDEELTEAHSLSAGDVDRDGHLDLFVAEMRVDGDNPDAAMRILFGDGLGGFHDVVLERGLDNHESRLGDLDGDGDLDILGKPFNWSTPDVRVWLNGGTGRPVDRWVRRLIDEATPWQPLFVTSGDIDQDGADDIVTGGWWYRNPDAAGAAWERRPIGEPLHNVAVARDFDNDGDVDLLGTEWKRSSQPGDDLFWWARNDGAGQLTLFSTGVHAEDPSSFLQGVAEGAFSTPGAKQVALSWQNGESGASGIQLITVPETDPDSRNWPTWQLYPDSQGEALSSGDIDGDGDLDLFQGTRWLQNHGSFWGQLPAGDPPEELGRPDRNRLGDIDGDGDLDAAVGFAHYPDENGAGRTSLVWFEAPDDPAAPWPMHIIGNEVGGGFSLDLADLDTDGDLDAVLGEHKGETRLIVFENLGGGITWRQHVIDPGGPEIDHHDGARFADIDRDGDLDVLSIGWYNDKVWLFENRAINCKAETPSVPANLQASSVGSSRVDLAWDSSSGPLPVAGYRVFRDGAEIATTASTTHTDLDVLPLSTYRYSVAAFDVEGGESAPSPSLLVTTPSPDLEPPSAPTQLSAAPVSPFRMRLSWNPATDNRDVAGYRVYRDGVEVGVSLTTSFVDVGLTPARSHEFSVSAFDPDGNASDPQESRVTAATPALDPLDGDLVAAYGFEEGGGPTAFDLSGNMHDGTLDGAIRIDDGAFGDALEFDGEGGGVDLGGLDVPGQGLTISMWFRVDDFEVVDGRLISKATGVAEDEHWWMISTFSEGRLRFRLKTDAEGTSTLLSAPSLLETGTWTHVAATYDGTSMVLYKDAEEVGRLAKTGDLSVDPSVLVRIADSPVGDRFLDGAIDEVRIHPRALTREEIEEEMLDPLSPTAECGNGVLETGEACDDGALNSNLLPDACRMDCRLPFCGDGVLDADEACDDGNALIGDGCLPSCLFEYDPDLVAAYDFEERGGTSVRDVTGKGHDGRLAGDATRRADGYFGDALEVDGQPGRVELDAFDVGDAGLTVALWLRADDFGVSLARLVTQSGAPDSAPPIWGLSTLGPRLRAQLTTSNGTSSLNPLTLKLTAGVWTHAAMTWDGSTLTLYQDGVVARSSPKIGALAVDSLARAAIGDGIDGTLPFDGLIDDVRVYRRALGPDEVAALMNGPVLEPGVCGDGVVDLGEDCDDGNPSDDDGCDATCIDSTWLIVEPGPVPGDIALSWAGGRPAYRVHRADRPQDVDLGSSEIAETDGFSWTDSPPPGDLWYYRVRVRP